MQPTAIPKPVTSMEELRFAIREGAYEAERPPTAWNLSLQQRADETRAYRERQRTMRDKIKADLEHVFGLASHPKRDVAWNIAWEERHSSGYEEVADFYQTLVELLK